MRYYFTLHRGDLIRARILPRARAMLVAAGMWDGRRLRVARPPRGCLASLCLDSGGFTAARRWGNYPWAPAAYAAWARATAERDALDFVAVMDYFCGPAAGQEALAANRARVLATVDNACRCRDADPSLPWLPVVQGRAAEDYLGCAGLYRSRGVPLAYAGLGSVCGRPTAEVAALLRLLGREMPGTRWHVFGMALGVLRDPSPLPVRSWDSYSWTWGKGSRGDRCRLPRAPGETSSSYRLRLAADYRARIDRLLARPRQPELPLDTCGSLPLSPPTRRRPRMNTTETPAAPARAKSLKQLQGEHSRVLGKLLAATKTAGAVAADLEEVRRQIALAEAGPKAEGAARAGNGG